TKINGYGGGGSGGEIVITGPFDLQVGYPYFVSATQDFDRWTYVGKVPERIIFNLKPGANYIALPLDTRLKKAVDICNTLGLYGSETVAVWDANQQNFFNGVQIGTFSPCTVIRDEPGSLLNFNLDAGKVYYVGGLIEEKPWTQE
ncbi:MAG: hypothetical protein K6T16_03135, partial [Candidatus Pacearchaeota archaeon]|nr:hypothetical protein [Candidatus Pacearchaeota archaeon]